MEPSRHLPPDEERRRYECHDNSPDNRGYVRMFRDFISFIRPFLSETKGPALDFGCGPGPVLAGLLREEGYTVDLYDPFFAPDRTVLGKTFSLVTTTEVLEHLRSPGDELRALASRVAPGGVLAAMTLFHPGDRDSFERWWYRIDPTHIAFYSTATMRHIARLTGMELLADNGRNTVVFRKNPA